MIKLASDRNRVLAELLSNQRTGLTCDQVEQNLNMPHQTASARLRELFIEGLAVPFNPDCGTVIRRATRTGRTGKVYFAAV